MKGAWRLALGATCASAISSGVYGWFERLSEYHLKSLDRSQTLTQREMFLDCSGQFARHFLLGTLWPLWIPSAAMKSYHKMSDRQKYLLHRCFSETLFLLSLFALVGILAM